MSIRIINEVNKPHFSCRDPCIASTFEQRKLYMDQPLKVESNWGKNVSEIIITVSS